MASIVCVPPKADVAVNNVRDWPVDAMERCIDRFTRKWLGLPPGLSSVALYSRSSKLKMPFRSVAEEFRISKIKTQLMINNSTDSTIVWIQVPD